MVGRDILRGRMLNERIVAGDYLHLICACLLHDIGFVRGILSGDTATEFVVNQDGKKVTLPRGASDAALVPYHVDRSKLFCLRAAREFDGGRRGARRRGDRTHPLSALPRRAGERRSRGAARSRLGSDRPARRPALSEESQRALRRVRGARQQPAVRLRLPRRSRRQISELLLRKGVGAYRRGDQISVDDRLRPPVGGQSAQPRLVRRERPLDDGAAALRR